MSEAYSRKLSDDLLRPLLETSWRFYLIVAFLGTIVLMGLGTWGYQMYMGFGMTGINNPIYWAFYITNFVFWIGISHAGTLISAILRLVNAGWRRPVTRCAEVITAFALMIGAMFPIIHLGRPWLFFWLVPYPSSRMIWPNFRSPLVWDFFAITTYLTGSVLFLVLPMIPDFALVRDRTTGMRHRIYGALALGWQGTPKQWHRRWRRCRCGTRRCSARTSWRAPSSAASRDSSSRWPRSANSCTSKSICTRCTSRTSASCC
jgi:molybdopterin-containing oxidoreductase family membrane subunit